MKGLNDDQHGPQSGHVPCLFGGLCAVAAPSLVDILLTYAFGTLTFVRRVVVLIDELSLSCVSFFGCAVQIGEDFHCMAHFAVLPYIQE